ncbi:MAG: cyclic nucleotide-binding domain-containing protein [Candidatus Omnitrophota bacterium]|nr:cyclic nucleotide-binding domain-containing protein [Candidatus Omnitrophota bacterium]
MARPQRWDEPFGPEMTDADVQMLLERPEISAIEAKRFPTQVPLTGILKNDTRIVTYKSGEIVVRENDYGNSAFLILSGILRVVLAPGLPKEKLGRHIPNKKNFLESLSQLWTNRSIPEVRDTRLYEQKGLLRAEDAQNTRVMLQDIPVVLDTQKTAELGEGQLFGELAALGRIPRSATVFAEHDATCLEIRWQGLRELRKFDEGWRRRIDEKYRENALKVHLSETPILSGIGAEAVEQVADHTLFETYGTFDWNISYQKMRRQGKTGISEEPVIAKEGDYPDGLLLVRAGFARVSVHHGQGVRTLTYLGKGDSFGLDELYVGWKEKRSMPLQTTLTALGYVDVLRLPSKILEQHVFSKIDPPKRSLIDLADRALSEDALLEWAVEERFVNATQAMLIDLDKCTRCDDCVRACASTHDGNPRFIRHGHTFDHWMVTNACLHCVDPVCLIGCPTGAINRNIDSGTVVINDNTCIGCGACANSCPYDNIRMVDIRNLSGKALVDDHTQKPLQKATKCDLCVDQLGGPACVRACPHDALKRIDFQTVMRQTSKGS